MDLRWSTKPTTIAGTTTTFSDTLKKVAISAYIFLFSILSLSIPLRH